MIRCPKGHLLASAHARAHGATGCARCAVLERERRKDRLWETVHALYLTACAARCARVTA